MNIRIVKLLTTLALAGLALHCGGSGGGDGENQLGPERSFEPDERLDFDNVIYFEDPGAKTGVWAPGAREDYFDLPYQGGMPEVEMGDPPKSGFRIAMPRVELEAYGEVEFCQSWPIPKDLAHRMVYSSSFYTGPGVHHANMFAVPIPEDGPNPYPNCRTPNEAMGASFGGFFDAALSNDISSFKFPQVMTVNSTQVVGAEHFFQPDGYAFEIPEGYEIVIDVHLQNPTGENITIESAWDFYTMPREEVTHVTQAMTYFYLDLNLPAQSRKTLTTQCDFFGDETAELTSIMPHAHQWAEGFTTNLLGGAGEVLNTPYDRMDLRTNDAWIESYDPPIAMKGTEQIEFSCHFNNDLDHDMGFGVGENEMCFFFGYVTPPEALSAGIILNEDVPCVALPMGQPEVLEEIDFIQYVLDRIPPEQVGELLGSFLGDDNE